MSEDVKYKELSNQTLASAEKGASETLSSQEVLIKTLEDLSRFAPSLIERDSSTGSFWLPKHRKSVRLGILSTDVDRFILEGALHQWLEEQEVRDYLEFEGGFYYAKGTRKPLSTTRLEATAEKAWAVAGKLRVAQAATLPTCEV